ncbi:MAG: tRNA (adenosine(37)-N6)-dimethylallyltransferase MiaA [Terriglobales bacterium]
MPEAPQIAIVVAGPTASGKTALALALHEQLRNRCASEIVNFDSVQLYRDFDVGTAKPTPAELGRAPHHLISVADAHTPWTAGEYARRARPVLEGIFARGHVAILTGGTGFYVRALLEGLAPAPASDAELRRKLQRRSPEQLHRLLQRLDPEAGERISPRDWSRTVRALEVRLLTGRPLGEFWRAAKQSGMSGEWPQLCVLRLGLAPERTALYARINRRAAAMFAGPIQEETRRLLASYPADLRIWSSHGYKQACDIVLRGADPAAALAEAQQEQRHYAKRQWTWFRAETGMRWMAGFGDELAVQKQAAELALSAGGAPFAPWAKPARKPRS